MPRYDYIDSSHLTMLAKIVDEHCAAHGITDVRARENVAAEVFHMFQQGGIGVDNIHALISDRAIRLPPRQPRPVTGTEPREICGSSVASEDQSCRPTRFSAQLHRLRQRTRV